MADATSETSWVPPGLPAPAPGEPAVETLISVAEGRARGAPWSVIAESRDLDFNYVRKWPWRFPDLWDAYLDKALKLQLKFQVGQSLNMLGALQNSGTSDESRRACETILHYNTILELIEQKRKSYASTDERGLTQIALNPQLETRDSPSRDDERTFLPRLPVVMPRGPNRTPRRPSTRRYALPTPEALAVLRRQLADPDPDIAHRAARTTLLHDVRMQYLEARHGPVSGLTMHAHAGAAEEPRSEFADMPFDFAENELAEDAESDDWTKDIAPDITPEELRRILAQIEANAQHDPMLRKALEIMKRPPPPDPVSGLTMHANEGADAEPGPDLADMPPDSAQKHPPDTS